jgi:predicted component of type VI protein secretion system
LEVEVVNTRANDLAGDANRMREVEQKGWLKNSYIKMYGKFDGEMVRSGLFGPVRLMTKN